MIVEQAEESIYGTKQISLPTPQCIVFYNGEKEMPEEQILRLSDAFENKERQADVELTVRMLNINHGHNKALMEKCRTLSEYAQFVAVSREYAAEGRPMQEALEEAEAALDRARQEYEAIHARVVALRMAEAEEAFPILKEE